MYAYVYVYMYMYTKHGARHAPRCMSTALPPYAPSLQPDCNQTATSPQPHASQVVATLLEVGGVYLLTTHYSLLTHHSLQVVATLLGWVVLSVASVVPSRHAPWASSGTLLWIDKCCINQETPETIKADRTSMCVLTYSLTTHLPTSD